jgi:DNA-binding transcriptional ArsR family regulator
VPNALPQRAFDALGDPIRLAIVQLLAQRPSSVQEIADRLPISRPAVSRHLKVLKAAELVGDESEGTRRIYHVRPKELAALKAYLERLWAVAERRFRLIAENTGKRGRRG